MKGKEAESNDGMYTILVVEDDEGLNRLIRKKLKRVGFRTEQALNGAEAISKVLETPNVVLLLDYLLPDMTGKELLIALARRKRRVPFIVMTGHGDEKIAVAMMKRGARDYMTKGPDFLDILPQVMRHVIGELTTERKLTEAEDALKERESEHQTILDSVPVGIFHMDSESRFVQVNEALAKRYELKPEDFKGKRTKELFPEDADAFVKSDKEVLRSGEPQIGIARKITVPEGVRWARLDKVPIKDAEGNVTGVIGFELDITEQKQSEELYRAIFENTGTGMIIVEEDATISYVNAEMKNVWGYSKEEIEGKAKWTKFVVEADLERMMEYHRLRRIDPESAPRSYEFRFIHKNGEVRDAALAAAMIPGTKKSIISLKDITERKRMEEELQRSETRYRTFFEATKAPTALVEEDTTLALVNEEFAKLAGYTKDELDGKKSWTEFVVKEDLEQMKKYHHARRGEPSSAPRNYEFRFLDRYGTVRNIYLTIAMIPGTKRSAASFMDITDLKEAEAELKMAHQRVMDILEFLPDATLAIDKEGKVIAWNRAIEEMTGIQKEEIIGKGDYAYAVPFYGVKRPILIDLVSLNDEEIESRYEYIKKQGDTLFAEAFTSALYGGKGAHLWGTASPLYDSEGNVIGAIESIRDVTDKKRAEETLRESEEKYRMLVDNVQDGIFILQGTPAPTLVFCNEAFATMVGYTVEEMMQLTIQQYVAPEDLKRVAENYQRRQAGEEVPQEYEYRVMHKAGRRIYVNMTAGLINYQGEIATMGTVKDVTERKQAEKKLLELINDLEIANSELRDFAYVVSHDLKTPLRAIHTLADWLSSDYADTLDDKGQEYLDLLRNRVLRMYRLIEGILQYSRLGRVAESKEEVDLNTIVSNAIDLVNPQENIKIDVVDELPTLYCDRTRMGEVFQNLLSNALKYMDKPEGLVTIGCTEEDKHWKFSVADNGPGIGEQYHEKIFQIFQMLHTRDEFESTGIGLTIVKKIVEMQGGKIWLESKEGEGSTFFFTIPKERRVSSSKTTA